MDSIVGIPDLDLISEFVEGYIYILYNIHTYIYNNNISAKKHNIRCQSPSFSFCVCLLNPSLCVCLLNLSSVENRVRNVGDKD